jgi:hypothetical protein
MCRPNPLTLQATTKAQAPCCGKEPVQLFAVAVSITSLGTATTPAELGHACAPGAQKQARQQELTESKRRPDVATNEPGYIRL